MRSYRLSRRPPRRLYRGRHVSTGSKVVIACSSSLDADRRPTLPKWTALAAAKSGGRNAPGRDLGTPRHKAQTAPRGFHFCAIFAFSHAVLRAGCTGDASASARAPENAANPDLRLPSLGSPSTWMRLRGAQAPRRGRRRFSSGPFALIAPPNSAKQGPDLYEIKDPHLNLSIMSTNDQLKRDGRGAFIWACHPTGTRR